MVYVIFETPGGEPARFCAGPYGSAVFDYRQLIVTTLRGGQPEGFCLAVQAADGWHVRQGAGAFARAWESVRFSDSPENE